MTFTYQGMRRDLRQTAQLVSAVVQAAVTAQAQMLLFSTLRDTAPSVGMACRLSIVIKADKPCDSDTPYSLMLAALQSIPVLTDTHKSGFDFTVYTGDLVSHDPDNQLSQYVPL